MTGNHLLHVLFTGVLFVSSGSLLLAQEAGTTNQSTQKKVEKVPMTQSNAASGKQMYKDYCAACHGANGKGDGPAADTLKTPPADLTAMAKNNNGKFPTDHFIVVMQFGVGGHAHGTSDMPIWGPAFHAQNKDLTELRIRNLASYVESIQQK